MHLLAVGGQAEKHYIEWVYMLALYTHNEDWEIVNAYLLLLYIGKHFELSQGKVL